MSFEIDIPLEKIGGESGWPFLFFEVLVKFFSWGLVIIDVGQPI